MSNLRSLVSPSVENILLPESEGSFLQVLFSLHRKLDSLYRDLPWPNEMQNVGVFTQVVGGLGDIVAAAKAIKVLQQMCPTVNIDWVIKNLPLHCDPKNFLGDVDLTKVSIRSPNNPPPTQAPVDFMLAGPVKVSQDKHYFESGFLRKLEGPIFGFLENGDTAGNLVYVTLGKITEDLATQTNLEKIYEKWHSSLFPSWKEGGEYSLPMGLRPGSGVFLETSRMHSPLSRGYCCPSYLLKIQDVQLHQQILESLNVYDGKSEPDYDRYSFNSGYAHRIISWKKFIDCVAMHEKNKNVVIVLNQASAFSSLSTSEFQEQILSAEHLEFLKNKGYGTVILKAKDEKGLLLKQDATPGLRSLTIIIRPGFSPQDMKQMQLASERILGTGDNSAVEAWCARCKLYLYEDVANCGCKWKFLQEQVDLAQTISPNLSRLLALFGNDRRLPDWSPNPEQPPSTERMTEIQKILEDPHLEEDTLKFCKQITEKFSFAEVLQGALKRAAWQHCLPQLAKIEPDTLDKSFRIGLIEYFKSPATAKKQLQITTFLELKNQIEILVQKALSPMKKLNLVSQPNLFASSEKKEKDLKENALTQLNLRSRIRWQVNP